MRKILTILLFLVSLFVTKPVFAADYIINDFNSSIVLNKNTDLTITETVQVDFKIPKHGIFRIIPVQYSAFGQTVNSRVKILSVSDENGNTIPFTSTRQGSDLIIKIGDANKTILDKHTYVISYKASKVVRRFNDHDEIYWNVTGSEWDTQINQASVSISSDFANIDSAVCFAGVVGTENNDCELGVDKSGLISSSKTDLGPGRDFTVVAILQRPNSLVFPNIFINLVTIILDNWGYVFSVIPLIFIIRSWYKKGRDITFGDKLYYGDISDLQVKPLFSRAHMPNVYSPINGLTPAQVGTLVDERVDIHDIVAEIVELARLGFLKIKSISKKDYEIAKLEKDTGNLLDYQKYLLTSLFPVGTGNEITTKDFTKNKFYNYLPELKSKIYKSVTELNLFDGNPENIRKNWLIKAIFVYIVCFAAVLRFITQTVNPGPYILMGITPFIAGFFVYNMPRKTAKGYALFRDVKGLANYLKIGKWRHEIYEKNLFLEEMIPLAISLGVVKRLAKQMRDLGIPEPKYFAGINAASFNIHVSSSIINSAPKSSSSGWSGGSGGGGFSGGGFGGGGGGSW